MPTLTPAQWQEMLDDDADEMEAEEGDGELELELEKTDAFLSQQNQEEIFFRSDKFKTKPDLEKYAEKEKLFHGKI